MISIYKKGDEYIWVPVAKENAGNAARAFLPFEGLSGEYLYGYKARVDKGDYLTAISDIQNSFLENISEIFLVNGGAKSERQKKANWRHGRQQDAPLLGPTKGWVRVPITRVTECTDTELAQAFDQSGSVFASLNPAHPAIEPVLSDGEIELSKNTNLPRKTILNRIPTGQVKPKRIMSAREDFVRDASVVAYVFNQARGIRECYNSPKPFNSDDGEPYLEVHHVRHLAKNGSDTVQNAIAACPNCHRELHFGVERNKLMDNLFANVERLVRE